MGHDVDLLKVCPLGRTSGVGYSLVGGIYLVVRVTRMLALASVSSIRRVRIKTVTFLETSRSNNNNSDSSIIPWP